MFTIARLLTIYEENAKLVFGKVHYLTEAQKLTKVDYCQVRLFKSDIFSDPFFVFFIQSPNLDCEFSTCYLCFSAVPLCMENPLQIVFSLVKKMERQILDKRQAYQSTIFFVFSKCYTFKISFFLNI